MAKRYLVTLTIPPTTATAGVHVLELYRGCSLIRALWKASRAHTFGTGRVAITWGV